MLYVFETAQARGASYDILTAVDTRQIVELLIAERDRLSQVIVLLQAPGAGRGTGKAVKKASTSRRKIVRTPEQREAQRERMRAYWAAKKKDSTKGAKSKKAVS